MAARTAGSFWLRGCSGLTKGAHMDMPDTGVVAAVAVVGAVLVVLLATGLGRLILLFAFTAALTLAVEGLVFLGLSLVAPGVMGVGLGRGLEAWALIPPLVVAAAVTFHAWREGV